VLQALADIVKAAAIERAAYYRYCCPFCRDAFNEVNGGHERQL
jgi:hypothetical protein